jgi:hypothetical protein
VSPVREHPTHPAFAFDETPPYASSRRGVSPKWIIFRYSF